ncbi:MAG TPA: DUF642 domain-containing protein, partial [Kofleriaceae bacterium]|nr:DUF642 domain-containing protein [Kofleriaceae bacterium]
MVFKLRQWATIFAVATVTLGAANNAYAICGDGTKEAGTEACDDGNSVSGDGCSATCTLESGFTCQDFDPLATLNPSFEAGQAIPQWEVLAGGVDWVSGTADNNCLPAGQGSYSIDLNQFQQGLIAQKFTTVPGRKYGVLFLASANCISVSGQPCNSSCLRTMAMGAARDTSADTLTDISQPIKTVQYTVSGSPQSAGWQRLRFEFTAQSTSTILYFWGSDTAAAGPMLDDISIPTSFCLPNTCGNGVIDAAAQEACDDGNAVGSDGCSNDCREIEVGYTCATAGAPCSAVCGDAVRQSGEGCDDGGVTPGDGCSATCTVETGWSCVERPPAQISTCTDIDLCATASCGMGTCVEIADGFTCQCNAGYQFDTAMQTCVVIPDVDYCAGVNCGPGTCKEVGNAFTCTCNTGYRFDMAMGNCVDIDECAEG